VSLQTARCLLKGALLVLTLVAPVFARAQPANPSEYQVKAAFLYNFAKFTDWSGAAPPPAPMPTSRDDGFVLCIAGKDPFGSALAAIEGKLVGGQPLRVRRSVPPDGLRGCHLLFIDEVEERRMPAYLKAAHQFPLLTVSDIEGFTDAGGMIGLVTADYRIQFDINLAPVASANLKISSQLLMLARSVTGGKGRK
jgi:hypothetical protein